jgi:hypothetical protein
MLRMFLVSVKCRLGNKFRIPHNIATNPNPGLATAGMTILFLRLQASLTPERHVVTYMSLLLNRSRIA